MAYNVSPVENQNKGYAGQEKKDLMNDNPIAKDASGGRPWISKHFRSSTSGSPVKHQGDGGHKKAFDYGDGKDNKRKKEHMEKVAHNRDGSHSNSIQANQKNRKG
jgi:hypothetical protein